ncbi:MAG: response regulator transcription factor [Bacteroidales bacterium]|nr:response regulator transcription factor [Bacteroidales bacterium]
MRKLTCIVVDDEPLAVKMLENFVSRTPDLELLASFNDPIEALGAIKEKKPDIAFLDIQMPELSGMELSRMLPEDTRGIFTTAFQQYALEGYEVDALDYLLKPIRYPKFLQSVEKAKAWFSMKEAASSRQSGAEEEKAKDSIFIKADGEMHRVMLSDILFITGMKDYVMISLEGRKLPLVTHITMKAVEDMLPKDSFMRIHRSYIISLPKIESVSASMDVTIAGQLLHVGDSYREEFLRYLESNTLK